MSETSLKQIKEQTENPLPTPPVGTLVNWFPHGKIEDENRCAAIVTKIEGAGKLTLTIFRPNALAEHRQGVHYKDHPATAKQAAQFRVHNGLWDYPKGQNIPKAHREMHLEELTRRRDAILDQERQQREAEEARQKKQEAVTSA